MLISWTSSGTKSVRVSAARSAKFALAMLVAVGLGLVGVLSSTNKIAQAQTTVPFSVTIDIAEDESYDVGYVSTGSITHGWRVGLVANYVNVDNPNDHLPKNLQLLKDGTWTPYAGADPPMVISPSPFPRISPDFNCGTDVYYDEYNVSGWAKSSLTESGRTYTFQNWSFDVLEPDGDYRTDAIFEGYNATSGTCCEYLYSSCDNCSVIQSSGSLTVTIHTSQNCP